MTRDGVAGIICLALAIGILGLILDDQIEVNLLRAVMSDPNPWLFFTRPISGFLLALSVGSVIFALWQHQRHKGRSVRSEDPDF